MLGMDLAGLKTFGHLPSLHRQSLAIAFSEDYRGQRALRLVNPAMATAPAFALLQLFLQSSYPIFLPSDALHASKLLSVIVLVVSKEVSIELHRSELAFARLAGIRLQINRTEALRSAIPAHQLCPLCRQMIHSFDLSPILGVIRCIAPAAFHPLLTLHASSIILLQSFG